MMKKIIILLITILIFHTIAFAGNNWIFKIGFNNSALRERESNTYNALSWGVERDISLSPAFSVGAELYYSKNRVSFDNVELWNEANIINSDIEISSKSLDFGVAMTYNLIHNNNFCLSFRFIPAACLNPRSSNINQGELIRRDRDWEKYEFILWEGNTALFPNFRLKMSFSVSVSYKYLYFELRYMRDFQPIGEAGNLQALNYRFHSINFLFGITM